MLSSNLNATMLSAKRKKTFNGKSLPIATRIRIPTGHRITGGRGQGSASEASLRNSKSFEGGASPLTPSGAHAHFRSRLAPSGAHAHFRSRLAPSGAHAHFRSRLAPSGAHAHFRSRLAPSGARAPVLRTVALPVSPTPQRDILTVQCIGHFREESGSVYIALV
jgi:hypothetical protein